MKIQTLQQCPDTAQGVVNNSYVVSKMTARRIASIRSCKNEAEQQRRLRKLALSGKLTSEQLQDLFPDIMPYLFKADLDCTPVINKSEWFGLIHAVSSRGSERWSGGSHGRSGRVVRIKNNR